MTSTGRPGVKLYVPHEKQPGMVQLLLDGVVIVDQFGSQAEPGKQLSQLSQLSKLPQPTDHITRLCGSALGLHFGEWEPSDCQKCSLYAVLVFPFWVVRGRKVVRRGATGAAQAYTGCECHAIDRLTCPRLPVLILCGKGV